MNADVFKSSLLAMALSGCINPGARTQAASLVNSNNNLPEGVFQISGTSASLPVDDLLPFGNFIEGTTIIGLGEGTHTSGGYHKLGVRLIRYLVVHHGYRALAFESNRGSVADLDRFVSSGAPAAEQAILGLFPQFQSTEMLDLLKWVRQFNQEHLSDQVHIFGFDVQEPVSNLTLVKNYVHKVAASLETSLNPGLSACLNAIDVSQHNMCQDALTTFSSFLEANMNSAVSMSSQSEFELGVIGITALGASADQTFFRKTDPDGLKASTARDVGMGELFWRVRRIIAPNAKTIIYGHLGHIAKQGEDLPEFKIASKTMGSVVFEKFGAAHKAFALLSYDTQRAECWTSEGEETVPTADSIEGIIHSSVGLDYAYVTVSNSLLANGVPYRLALSKFTDPDTGHSEVAGMKGIPAQHLNGIFYLQSSPPMAHFSGDQQRICPH